MAGITSRALPLVLVLAMPHSLYAQDDSTQGPPAPTGRFDALTSGFTAGLDVSEDESKTSADISGAFVRREDDGSGTQRQRVLRWKVGVEYPFGGGDDLLDADLDALGNQASLSAGLTLSSFSSSTAGLDHPRFRQHMEAAIAACRVKNAQVPHSDRVDCEILRAQPASVVVQDYLPAVFTRLSSSLYSAFWTVGIDGSLGAEEFKWVEAGR